MTLGAGLLAAVLTILALLMVSAVFSAAETALTGASRGRMHQLERDGDRAAGRVNAAEGDDDVGVLFGTLGDFLAGGARRIGRLVFNVDRERHRRHVPLTVVCGQVIDRERGHRPDP